VLIIIIVNVTSRDLKVMHSVVDSYDGDGNNDANSDHKISEIHI
jgi:hypothetical protein